jgi:myosin heavy subunit
MFVGAKHRSRIYVSLAIILYVYSMSAAYSANRPFWTEKSSFIEGDELFVVGVASKAPTVEAGRRLAFEQGKVELMNFAQITSLEAQGLVIETQMTFEEPNTDGTVTVYRLLRVPAGKLVMIQGRLQTQSRAQEQAIDQSRRELAAFQQSLTEKAAKLDQQQRQVEQTLQQINEKLQSGSTSSNRSERSGSLVDRLRETDAKLDASEQELSRLARQIQERVKSRSQKACRYVMSGMNPSEVSNLLGSPDGKEKGPYTNFLDTWGYGDTIVHFSRQGVVGSISGCR